MSASPAVHEPATDPPVLSQRQLWIILGSLMLGTVLAALDTTIVSTALPTITGKLGGFSSYAWVGTSYILASTIATPILGKLGDLFGRRRVVLSAITIFLVGSLLCGLSRNMTELIFARGVQGLGGGGIQALTFAILGDLVSPRERGRYMGMYTGAYAASAVIGPLVGGWMIDHFAWQWIFLFNVPVAALALVFISATLRFPFRRRAVEIDFLGAGLLSAALGSLVVGLERGRSGWLRTPVVALFLLSAIAIALFVGQERRSAEPLLPLRLFRNRVFAVSSALGFLAGTFAYGAQQFLPLQFQDANFVTPTRAGLYVAPIMVGVMLGSGIGGRLIARTGRYKIFPIIGFGLATLGVAVVSRIGPHTSFLVLVLPMLGMGIGMGSTFTTSSIASQNAIDPKDIGVGTAALVAQRTLGGSIGLAVYGTIFTLTVRDHLAATVPVGALSQGTPLTRLLREPAKIKALAPAVRNAVVDSISRATGRVFLIATPVAVVAFVLATRLPELPLRTTSGAITSAPDELLQPVHK